MKHIILLLLTTVILISVEAQISVYPYTHEGKCGLVNENNEKVKEAVFDHIWLFPNQKFNSYTKFSKVTEGGSTQYGLLDKEGNIVIPAKYENLQYDGNGYFYYLNEDEAFQIKRIEDNKLIRELDLAYLEAHNGIIIFRPENEGTYTALFKSGKLMDLPPSSDNYKREAFPKSYTVTDVEEACPSLIVKNDYYDCMGDPTQPNYGFHESEVRAYSSENPEEQTAHMRNLYPNEEVTPVKNRFGDIASYIINTNLVVSPDGDTMFHKKTHIPRMRAFTSHFENEEVYIKYGYIGQPVGLLTAYGKEILDMEYNIESPSKRDFILENAVLQEDLFYIEHLGSGYGGFLNRWGEKLLPKECKCIQE